MANESQAIEKKQKTSLVAVMAAQYQMEPAQFFETVKKTVFPNGGQTATNEQLAAFLAVANEYNLNPFTREIYAFPTKSGGIQPVVSIDGWAKIVNGNPNYDGCEFSETFGQDGRLASTSCTMYRKDRSHPTIVTEYFTECYRKTEPWDRMPIRMLRHKAYIQCGRYAFGFSGVRDEDEALDMIRAEDGAYQMQEKTQEKTEIIKEKLAKAKLAAVPPPEEPKQPTRPSEPPTTGNTIGGIVEATQTIQAQFPDDDGLFSSPPVQASIQDRLITREEWDQIKNILTAKRATKTIVYAEFAKYGYKSSNDIRLKNHAALLAWAKSLPENKEAS